MKRRGLPSIGRPPPICRKRRGRSAGSNMARHECGRRRGWKRREVALGRTPTLKETGSPSEDEGLCRAKSRQRGYAALASLERAPGRSAEQTYELQYLIPIS